LALVLVFAVVGCAAILEGNTSNADFASKFAPRAAPVAVAAPPPPPPPPPSPLSQPPAISDKQSTAPLPASEAKGASPRATDYNLYSFVEVPRNNSAKLALKKKKSKNSSLTTVNSTPDSSLPKLPVATTVRPGSAAFYVPNPVKTDQPFDVFLWVAPDTLVEKLTQQFAKENGFPPEWISLKPKILGRYRPGQVQGVPDLQIGDDLYAELKSIDPDDLEFAQKGQQIKCDRGLESEPCKWTWSGIRVKPRTPEKTTNINLTLEVTCRKGCEGFKPIVIPVELQEPFLEYVVRRATYYLNMTKGLIDLMTSWLIALLALLGALLAVIHFKTR
jgi:hypothetical protein